MRLLEWGVAPSFRAIISPATSSRQISSKTQGKQPSETFLLPEGHRSDRSEARPTRGPAAGRRPQPVRSGPQPWTGRTRRGGALRVHGSVRVLHRPRCPPGVPELGWTPQRGPWHLCCPGFLQPTGGVGAEAQWAGRTRSRVTCSPHPQRAGLSLWPRVAVGRTAAKACLLLTREH